MFDPSKRPSASECLQHRFFGYTGNGTPDAEKLAIQIPKEAFVHEEGDVTIEALREQLLFEGISLHLHFDMKLIMNCVFLLAVSMYKHDENKFEDDSLGSKLTVMDETIKITVSETPSPVSPAHTYEHSTFGESSAVEEVESSVDSVTGEVVIGEVALAALSKTPESAAELVMSENASEEALQAASKVSVEKFSPVAKTLPWRKVIRERSERNLSRDTIIEAFVPPPLPEMKEDIPLPSAVVIPKKILSPVTTKQLRDLKQCKMITTAASASTITDGGEDRPLSLDYEPSMLRTAAVHLEPAVVTGGNSLSQKKREGESEALVCGSSLTFGFCNSQGDESPTISAVVAREKEKKLPKTSSCTIT